jgi:predicted dienelactone hydrolase
MRVGIVVVLVLGLAAFARGADPAKPGPFRVGVATVQAVDSARGDRALTTEIWYPAKKAAKAARDAEPLPRAFPLILMAHGHCGSRTNYEYLTIQLASRGFVVASPDFPGLTSGSACDFSLTSPDDMPLDLSFVCRELHDTGGPLARFAVHVRGVPTGLVGHSLGGFAVVKATQLDPAFTTVVPLAPLAGGSNAAELAGLGRALMVMGGTADATIPFDGLTQPFFDGLDAPAFLVRIAGGTHSGFTDMDSHLTPDALAAQQTIVRRYATAFFTKYLAGKKKFGKFLKSADTDAVVVTARAK